VEGRVEKLFEKALAAAKNAYAPYSHFRVGAALLCDGGETAVVTGVNVENRSFGLTICAERSAVVSAVSRGFRHFTAIAIATPDSDLPVGPCGACRQVLSEFMEKDAVVVFGNGKMPLQHCTIEELYPFDSLHELAAHENAAASNAGAKNAGEKCPGKM
jgi:cytidine deaminase